MIEKDLKRIDLTKNLVKEVNLKKNITFDQESKTILKIKNLLIINLKKSY